ncbi:MAG: hypothetical protein ACRD0J_07855 [Acidimicrobiales bacterium]
MAKGLDNVAAELTDKGQTDLAEAAVAAIMGLGAQVAQGAEAVGCLRAHGEVVLDLAAACNELAEAHRAEWPT